MTGYTSPDGLPYPDDYNDPADVPAAVQSLAGAVQAALDSKSLSTHTHPYAPSSHTHDDRYFTESEVTSKLSSKSDTNHTHDTRYYTEGEVDTKLAGKSDTSHNHDTRYYTETEMDTKLNGKANSSHSHSMADLPFRAGRPNTAFPIGADASTGNITIAHGLGRMPSAVFVSADDDGGDCTVFASVETFDATNIIAHMRNVGAAEAHVYINWIAF